MTTWTDERVALLKELAAEGYSAQTIATRLGGLTRNSVLGKTHRMRIKLMGSPAGSRTFNPLLRKPRIPRKRVLVPRVPTSRITNVPYYHCPEVVTAPLPMPKVEDMVRVSFEDLEEHHCRFIPFEPMDGFCGLPKVEGTSYCPGHLHRCTSEWEGRTANAHARIGGTQTTAAVVAEILESA